MPEKPYTPPYSVTDAMIHLVAEISEQVGVVTVKNESAVNPHLRRDNQIRTIHSSLAIENNSLSLEQMTDVIHGKRVLGVPKEIREVKNAYEAYNLLLSFDPCHIDDLLKAHKILMLELTNESGRFRSGGAGVFAGSELVHMAPPAELVPKLISDLFHWVKNADTHPLIKSCLFHYEFEFIHPFADGNGRMGRMWQTLLLSRWKPVFHWLPVETLIRERQNEYYKVLALADKAADSTAFIEFMLRVIRDSLRELIQTEQVREQVTEQVERLMMVLGNETLSAKELLERLGLKHRPTFSINYLRPALELGLIEMTVPDKPNSSRQKYRAIKKTK
ncbi:Fic family protein [Desulfitobacterium chlororespirans]|uniref:Fic family protein n=1 Tax=Desulfitobacterium chlororespirans DSM 11544 TaxID=1121395 RepID=A0A1M7RW56_9FIRM|nr:Fic family protein [Desulfitobacterium chlororespirans]SHN50406.1 Fic family protein [Desulfitobacterium chlororespirans DSM 11544]